jgi:hypothetical protein
MAYASAGTLKGAAEVEIGLPPIKLMPPSIMLNADIIEERPYISMATFYRPPQEVVSESS